MKIDTIKGCSYVVTCTGACTVQVLQPVASPITILEAAKAGQYVFVAPTDAVEVSDEHALVTQTFKAASLGSSAQGGGIGNGENAMLNSLSVATVDCSGPATFNAGVTMAQSLTVDGNTILKGGMGVGGVMLFYDSYGAQAAQISGEYLSPDENGVVLGNGGGMDFLRIKYNSASKYIDIQPLISGSTFCLPLLAPISVNGSCSADSFQFGPNNISFDPSNPTRVVTSGAWGFGSADFAGGVTMAQSLNVEGDVFCKRLVLNDGLLTLSSLSSEACVYANYGKILISRANGARNICIEFNTTGAGIFTSITKTKAGSLGLTDKSILNRAEGDARWAQVRTDLTEEEYAALPEKGATTFYITSDTGKVYIGTKALN